jgi:cystathionine beta-lyase
MQITYDLKNNKFIDMKFNTKVIHGGQHHDPSTGAVMPSISNINIYTNQSTQPLNPDYEYSRAANQLEVHLKMLWLV